MAKPEVTPTLLGATAAAVSAGLLASRVSGRTARSVLWAGAGLGLAVAGNEAAGRPVPFLRWSFLRMMLGMRHLTREWQVGDGREEAVAEYVARNARRDDLDDVIRAIDEFCQRRRFLMNVGPEKGEILDEVVRRAQPGQLLELGTYCGYGALRLARAAPRARVITVELMPANAAIARRIHKHAGVGDRVEVVVGSVGDGGATLDRLRTVHGLTEGSLDLVFLDHDKDAYLPDLQRIEAEGWLRPGSVVVADNVRFPGAPEYRAFMRERQGHGWQTREHQTHVEYQAMLKDLVLESTYVGPQP
ncbi:MAG TPA: class I SAM-dependent methyltransferase [Pseudonocardia sp.]|jgi:catechol O-methyltransferase